MPHHEGIHATGCASPKTCIVNVDLFPEKMNLLLDWISRQALLDPVFQDPYPHSIRIPLEWFPSANQTWPVRNIIHVQQPFMDDCPTKRSHSPVRCSITRGLYNVIYIYCSSISSTGHPNQLLQYKRKATCVTTQLGLLPRKDEDAFNLLVPKTLQSSNIAMGNLDVFHKKIIRCMTLHCQVGSKNAFSQAIPPVFDLIC